jgi:hypothetical protein
MPHKACGEVFRNPCALTLGDEPLTGGKSGPGVSENSLSLFLVF